MSLNLSENTWTERRSVSRVDVICPARLMLPSGHRSGHIQNISEKGARLKVANPPQPGVTVLLQWLSHEVFCEVVWSLDEECGVTFEKPLPLKILEETCGAIEKPAGPVVRHSNIPLGQKRNLRPC